MKHVLTFLRNRTLQKVLSFSNFLASLFFLHVQGITFSKLQFFMPRKNPQVGYGSIFGNIVTPNFMCMKLQCTAAANGSILGETLVATCVAGRGEPCDRPRAGWSPQSGSNSSLRAPGFLQTGGGCSFFPAQSQSKF